MFGCSDVYHWMGRAAKAEAVPYGTKVCWRRSANSCGHVRCCRFKGERKT